MRVSFIRAIFIAMFYLIAFVYGQEDTLKLKDIYMNVDSKLLFEKVITFDSLLLSQEKIRGGFETWSEKNFNNVSAVMSLKTATQIVIDYIINPEIFELTDVKWNIKLIAEFKDTKIRIRFYDNGNVYWPHKNYPLPEKSQHFVGYFEGENILVYKLGKKTWNGYLANGFVKVRNSIERISEDIETFINKTAEDATDW